MTSGRLYGVGVGPGDPELMTIKAQQVIAAADVVAYPGAEHGRSVARTIAAPYLRGDQIELPLRYPVTTGTTDHPGGYEAAIAEFYDRSPRSSRSISMPAATSPSCARATRSSTAPTCTSTTV